MSIFSKKKVFLWIGIILLTLINLWIWEEINVSIKQISGIQNTYSKIKNDYLEVKNKLGSLAPLPGPTVEGTSTAGWTDDGSIVRLNTQSDNVGIGTINPSTKLQVQGAANITGNLTVSGGTFTFSQGTATTSATIIANGNLGIGSTTPDRFLSVQGSGIFSGGLFVGGNLTATGSTLRLGNLTYTAPSTINASNTILAASAAGGLSFNTATQLGIVSGSALISAPNDNAVTNSTTTLLSTTVTANTLAVNEAIVITAQATSTNQNEGSPLYGVLSVSLGGYASSSCGFMIGGTTANHSATSTFTWIIRATSATTQHIHCNSVHTSSGIFNYRNVPDITLTSPTKDYSSANLSRDLTADQLLLIIGQQGSTRTPTTQISVFGVIVELLNL